MLRFYPELKVCVCVFYMLVSLLGQGACVLTSHLLLFTSAAIIDNNIQESLLMFGLSAAIEIAVTHLHVLQTLGSSAHR
jgi:hypothetical protein